MSRTVLPWTSLLQFPGGWKMCTSPVAGTSQIAIKRSLNSSHGKEQNSTDPQPPMAFGTHSPKTVAA